MPIRFQELMQYQ